MPPSWLIRFALPILIASFFTHGASVSKHKSHSRQSSINIVTGVLSQDSEGHVGVRHEVRDLKENYPDQWNLYLLALASLQESDQRDPLSFYGIASIHGRPYQTWGDASGIPDKIGREGYCPHGNQVFLGWHRPYVALFEQTLQARMQRIVEASPSNRYAAAADTFRVPYWDWGLGHSGGPVPDIFLTKIIEVVYLNGSHGLISNPLYSYHFHPIMDGHFEGKWASLNSTVRWPTSPNDDAVSQEDRFQAAYTGQQQNILDQLGMAFRSDSFEDLSSILENPHGWIHGIVGGGYDGDPSLAGHFWPLEYSAFEPMFMLHHANIDRLFALYQAAHPDHRMVTSNVGSSGNLFLEDGEWVDGDTELLPFRKQSGGFWTTNDCWDHTILGYTYPELQPWLFGSDDEYHNSIIASISRLYDGSARGQLVAQKAAVEKLGGKHAQGMFVDEVVFTEWLVQTQARPQSLPPPFVIRFSFGDTSSNTGIDVGTWMVLMPLDQEHPSSSVVDQRPLNGTISLTSHLLDRIHAGQLNSLDPEDVVPYLQISLAWKAYSGNGTLIELSKLSALSVQVLSTEARVPGNPDMPVIYSQNVTAHPEVTKGVLGGIKV